MLCAGSSRRIIVSDPTACCTLRVRQNRCFICVLSTTTNIHTCGVMVVDCDYGLLRSGPACVGYGHERGPASSANPTSSTSTARIRASVEQRTSEPESQKRVREGCRHKA